MKIKIIRVTEGAKYEEFIYDYWIDAETQDGMLLKIFDCEPFDLRNMEGNVVDVALLAMSMKKNDSLELGIKGRLVSGVDIEVKEWTHYRKLLSLRNRLAFETNYGIFLLDESDLNQDLLKVGKTMEVIFGRIDIVAVKF